MDPIAACLEAHDLYRFYHASEEETLALRGVSLSLRPAETVAVTGPSGSGKSTLLNCLAGLDEPDGGWVAVMGKRMTRRPERERAALRARYIAVLLQSGNLLNHLTVADNLRVAISLAPGGRQRVSVDAALGAVGLAERARALPAQLSGGELARAGLALALMNDPPVLLADEPTGEVDAVNEARLLDLLVKRAHEGGSNLIVTHSPAVASVADRVLHLVDGRLEND
jgi:putative ABC transport system ATP-binding protein